MDKVNKENRLALLRSFPAHVSLTRGAFIVESILVNVESGCWEWAGPLNDYGYGVASYQGKTYRAHRLIYFWFYPAGDRHLTLDHLCRNKKCVNPNHLDLVSRSLNSARVYYGVMSFLPITPAKERTHCTKGHAFAEVGFRVSKKGYRRCRACEHIRNIKRHRGGGPGSFADWRAKNPEKGSPEYRKQLVKAWRRKHPDKVAAYAKNRKSTAEYQREWLRKNPEKAKEYAKRGNEKRRLRRAIRKREAADSGEGGVR